MATKNRNGNLYFYSNRREGGRVISTYRGSGAIAELAAIRAKRERQRQEEEKARLEARKLEAAEVDGLLEAFGNIARDTAAASLLIAGFRQHKGQWRKKHNVSSKKN